MTNLRDTNESIVLAWLFRIAALTFVTATFSCVRDVVPIWVCAALLALILADMKKVRGEEERRLKALADVAAAIEEGVI